MPIPLINGSPILRNGKIGADLKCCCEQPTQCGEYFKVEVRAHPGLFPAIYPWPVEGVVCDGIAGNGVCQWDPRFTMVAGPDYCNKSIIPAREACMKCTYGMAEPRIDWLIANETFSQGVLYPNMYVKTGWKWFDQWCGMNCGGWQFGSPPELCDGFATDTSQGAISFNIGWSQSHLEWWTVFPNLQPRAWYPVWINAHIRMTFNMPVIVGVAPDWLPGIDDWNAVWVNDKLIHRWCIGCQYPGNDCSDKAGAWLNCPSPNGWQPRMELTRVAPYTPIHLKCVNVDHAYQTAAGGIGQVYVFYDGNPSPANWTSKLKMEIVNP